jgi:hypothetical protein
MTLSQVPPRSRRRMLRRAPFTAAALVLPTLATLAACSSGPAKPTPSASPTISVAAQVPAAPKACAVSATLVNSCRPWLGAAAGGNPGASNSATTQFTYLERLLGHHLDIYRAYNAPLGHGSLGVLPLSPTEKYFAEQPDTYVDVNWQPSLAWAQSDGGDATVNAQIKQAADNIKAIAPHKIFLTIWWEPQSVVSGGTSCPVTGKSGKGGTPAQYKQMWSNVQSIFRAQGVTNVVWAMDYMSLPKFDCLVPQLWPGNSAVDWVLYDSYDRDTKNGSSWSNTVGRFYALLQHDSSSSVDFDAKPWGLGEFGTCRNRDAANVLQYFQTAKQSVAAGTYPRLKMYVMFADTHGPLSGRGCLPDYNANGQISATKNSAVKDFFNGSSFNR